MGRELPAPSGARTVTPAAGTAPAKPRPAQQPPEVARRWPRGEAPLPTWLGMHQGWRCQLTKIQGLEAAMRPGLPARAPELWRAWLGRQGQPPKQHRAGLPEVTAPLTARLPPLRGCPPAGPPAPADWARALPAAPSLAPVPPHAPADWSRPPAMWRGRWPARQPSHRQRHPRRRRQARRIRAPSPHRCALIRCGGWRSQRGLRLWPLRRPWVHECRRRRPWHWRAHTGASKTLPQARWAKWPRALRRRLASLLGAARWRPPRAWTGQVSAGRR
mmetsp:Transcript_109889/g.354797  ORF Transcript_109889/g.354797 Transcript_109889/m.354797 type:complete len:274 (-) Transcript_109889:893-1714(-)